MRHEVKGVIAVRGFFIEPAFQHQADAERFLRDFQERLAKFGLEIHPEETRLIAFGRFAASDCRKRGKGKPETFAFLGFTHYCGTNSKGHFVVWRRTLVKRMRAKLHAIKQELRRKMHEPVADVGAWLKRKVDGYYSYHAVPGNLAVLGRFRERLAATGGMFYVVVVSGGSPIGFLHLCRGCTKPAVIPSGPIAVICVMYSPDFAQWNCGVFPGRTITAPGG